jgi:molecular chaperone DnaK
MSKKLEEEVLMAKQFISKAVGIDLGTTNSSVAIMNPTDTNIIIHKDPNAKRETTPSCVWKNPKTGEVAVGHRAFMRVGTSPPPVRSIKRKMGKQIKEKLADEEMAPEQISAFILKEMKRQIEEDVGHFSNDNAEWIVDRAIITVPAYFYEPQIDATRKAGEMAGFQVLELLHEPTASACYYCWQKNIQDGIFLVYDLGGGTFDVTVLRCTAGAFEVLGISGNTFLGGDDMDKVLAEHLKDRLLKEGYALDLDVKNSPEDKLRFDKLVFLAEGVKKALSTSGEFLLRDNGSMHDKNGNLVIIETEFTRPEVEALIMPIVTQTIPYCFDALEQAERKAGVKLADVDAIILAGGPAHIPLVREIVRQNLCSPQSEIVADERARQQRAKCEEPVYEKVDTIVALGAAIRAAATGGLAVYNEEKTVRVSFRGISATEAKETYVGGKVEALDSGINLAGGRIRLTIPDLNFRDEDDLKGAGTFSFRGVQLQPSADNLLNFEVYDKNGKLVAIAGRQIKQSEEAVHPTGDGTGTAVLSKAIVLEVSREGKPYRKVLFEALETLPIIGREFNFLHPGDTELIRLPLYQNKRKIQEIKVDVPSSQPKGTPIYLNIAIDEMAFITVKGKIGEKEFDAAVELPPDREMPSEEEIQSLERSFSQAVTYLPAGRRSVAEATYKRARQNFEIARRQGEKEQAINYFEEMEEIVAKMSNIEGMLQPPKEFFIDLAKECFELNQYVAQEAGKAGKTYDLREMAKAIDAQRMQGEKAFAAEDQKAYSECILMLENIRNHIIALARKIIMPVEDPRTEAEKATDHVRFAEGEASKVSQFAASQSRKDLQDETEQIKNQLNQLSREAQKNPRAVQEKVAQLRARLEQIKNVLMGKAGKAERDDGKLVIDHGA